MSQFSRIRREFAARLICPWLVFKSLGFGIRIAERAEEFEYRDERMWRVGRSANGGFVIFTLSGRIEVEQVAELRRLFEAESQPLVLDLDEIELVDREAVRFLARCQAEGIKFERCPTYIREWMVREADGK